VSAAARKAARQASPDSTPTVRPAASWNLRDIVHQEFRNKKTFCVSWLRLCSMQQEGLVNPKPLTCQCPCVVCSAEWIVLSHRKVLFCC